jgi:hypothetical protein
MNERFATLFMMFRGQRLGLDFSSFDDTQSLGEIALTRLVQVNAAAGSLW